MGFEVDNIQLNFNQDSLWLLNVCLAVIMFGVALDLRVIDFKLLIKNPKPTLIGVFSQFLFLPFLTFLLVLVIEPIPSIAIGMILVAACPGGNISNFMTHLSKGNTALSINLTGIATLLALIMTPLNLKIWGSLYPPTTAILNEVSLDPVKLFKTISLILILPLIIGMSVNALNKRVAHKISKILKPVSIIIFIAFVVVAFSKNTDIFLEYFQYVVLIVLLHNGIAILSGYWVARLSGLSFQDQKTLAIETGIQNSGLGLILVFGFFKGLGGMAIVAAWWGIWHIISGLLISWYWSRNSGKTHQSIFKKAWYYCVKAYVFTAFQFYFSKIIIRGKKNIPKKGPVIFVANHQNALLDALVAAVFNERHTHFLVRADIFKKKWMRKLLGTLNMMPVFRVRDGMSSIKQNDQIFDYCSQLLNDGESILVFPEGNHSLKRRIRSLSKGFTRLAFGTLAKNSDLDIQIVPIGLNYENHQAFRKGVGIYFGKPVSAKEFYNQSDSHTSALKLKDRVEEEMKKLVTHIDDLNRYDEILAQLETTQHDYLNPEKANELIEMINRREGINERSHYPMTVKVNYLFGLVNSLIGLFNFLPLQVWKSISGKIKDPVMVGTLKFAVGITIFPIYYLLLSFLSGWFFGVGYGLATLILLSLSLPYYRK